ncbi:Vms1/Ankzf1 family peptidyl-tRNA hydrolase [Halostella litorea]|uniref:Vms1/Ankzf1 family peptidyl-tRNA hydrolase n=1 Tax=Halostella litorea TaxID=2528831 RepID=UPI001092CA42|nr:Vms1/Ankzf1 family peptidyl-tRNA hydrolase [Halostella litorea]
MLDELLGRAALKDRIDELEEEKRHLERRLEAESERRADAVSARQDAEQRVNRLEDRIAELEDRVERAGDGDAAAAEFRGVEELRGDRLAAVLDRLDSVDAGEEGAMTAMVGDEVPAAVREAFGDRAALVDRASPCLAVTDDAGLVSAALAPPVAPAAFAAWDDGFRVEREWFLPTGEFAFALVRSDLFALGEYDGRERTATTAFESDVKGSHSKGGFSQARFERRRDEQVAEHVERCEAALADRDADRLILVGEHTVLDDVDAEAAATAAVDATGDPEDALDEAFYDFWTTTLYRL